jgi:hypothetical protein
MSLLGRLEIPLHCFGIILRHSVAVSVHNAKDVLGTRMSLLSGFTMPFGGLYIVLRCALL